MLTRLLSAAAAAVALIVPVQGVGNASLQPPIIPHSAWQSQPPVGYPADATRRNKRSGDSLAFRDLTITVLGTTVDSSGARPVDMARLRLALAGTTEERIVREGLAFNWREFHVAVVAIYGPGELGAGLVALEVATVASLSPRVASSDIAGGADMRLRIPHTITHVTLHHTGSPEPLRPEENPMDKMRGLQSWGARHSWRRLPTSVKPPVRKTRPTRFRSSPAPRPAPSTPRRWPVGLMTLTPRCGALSRSGKTSTPDKSTGRIP